MRLSSVLLLAIAAQDQPQTPGPRPEFEVVSIKLGDPADPTSSTSSSRLSPGRLEMRNTTLANLIFSAYRLKLYQLEGGPKWMHTQRFHVDAKLPAGVPRDQMPLMMQAMLAERFQLEFHRVTKLLPVYNLVVAKGGPKLQPANADDLARSRSTQDDRQIKGWGQPVSSLAQMLINVIGVPVIDQTGLEGKYTFILEFAPQTGAREDELLPSIFTVLQKRLGLRLESAKRPVEMLVVDRAERPSEN
jgi:uncharacterized protein (TIGR03435 family)